jgi:hypothetical protein
MATTDDLVGTRLSLQAVAEHVLSAALHAATGRIGLRATPGGFGTPWFPGPPAAGSDGETEQRLRVEGVELVVERAGEERRTALTTLGAAAAFAEVAPGAPTDVYTPATALDLDVPLFLLPRAAADLARWFTLVDEALESFRAEHAALEPDLGELWPEHFDVATTMAKVNYGGSPGDEAHDEPYLYVGPWSPHEGPFWNEPFGASISWTHVPDSDAALAFFRHGFDEASA